MAVLILMVALAAFAFAAYRVYFRTPLHPAAPIPDTPPPPRSVVASIAPANQPPFTNLLRSLFERNSEGFIYWRDRLYQTAAGDVQEYVTRVIDAAYSTGKLERYYYVLAEATSLAEVLKSDRHLRSTFPAEYADLLKLLADLNTSIGDTILPLQQLLSYNQHPCVLFPLEGDPTYTTMLECMRNELADLGEWSELMPHSSVTQRAKMVIAKSRRNAVAAAGIAMGVYQLIGHAETESATPFVCLRAATSLSRLLEIVPTYLEANASAIRSLASQCASRVPPDAFEFPLLSSTFQEANLQLPNYSPLPTGGTHHLLFLFRRKGLENSEIEWLGDGNHRRGLARRCQARPCAGIGIYGRIGECEEFRDRAQEPTGG